MHCADGGKWWGGNVLEAFIDTSGSIYYRLKFDGTSDTTVLFFNTFIVLMGTFIYISLFIQFHTAERVRRVIPTRAIPSDVKDNPDAIRMHNTLIRVVTDAS